MWGLSLSLPLRPSPEDSRRAKVERWANWTRHRGGSLPPFVYSERDNFFGSSPGHWDGGPSLQHRQTQKCICACCNFLYTIYQRISLLSRQCTNNCMSYLHICIYSDVRSNSCFLLPPDQFLQKVLINWCQLEPFNTYRYVCRTGAEYACWLFQIKTSTNYYSRHCNVLCYTSGNE